MLVVSLDALVCGLKLPRALRGFVQQAHEPASFVLLMRHCCRAPWRVGRASILRRPAVLPPDSFWRYYRAAGYAPAVMPCRIFQWLGLIATDWFSLTMAT